MYLFIIITLAVWAGIILSRIKENEWAEIIAFPFRIAYLILAAPFRVLRWIFGKDARDKRWGKWQAEKSIREAKEEATRRQNRTLGKLYMIIFLMMAVLGLMDLALNAMASRFGQWVYYMVSVVLIAVIAVAILWWNKRWQRLHGPAVQEASSKN
jgi:hypothetical protein